MDIKYIKHEKIDVETIKQICEIKEENWKYSIQEQKNWITENIKNNDVHVLIFSDDKKLIGYANLIHGNCLINNSVDREFLGVGNVCVNFQFKKKGIGKFIMNNINDYIVKHDTIGILFCRNKLIDFYLKCDWNLFNSNNITTLFDLTSITTLGYNIEKTNNIKIIGSKF